MNNSQLNTFELFMAVQLTCHKNKHAMDNNVPFAESFKEFEATTQTIQDILACEANETAYDISKKKVLEAVVAETALEINSSIYVFAHDICNFTLREKAHYEPREIQSTRDTNLLHRAKAIYKNADKLIHYLHEYGVTEAELEDFRNKISDYENIVAQNLNKLSLNSSAAIIECLDEANYILTEKLDVFIEDSKEEYPKFFDAYMDARNNYSKMRKKIFGNTKIFHN